MPQPSKEEMSKLFHKIDTNQDGSLSEEEVRRELGKRGYTGVCLSTPTTLTTRQPQLESLVESWMAYADTSGVITKETFVAHPETFRYIGPPGKTKWLPVNIPNVDHAGSRPHYHPHTGS